MKVVILAGGLGTRLSEESVNKPKPMVEVGDYPILWHIMKIYSHYGYNDFVILLGYKGHMVKDYFMNYAFRHADVSLDMAAGQVNLINSQSEPWKITFLETGLGTMTGGRIRYAQPFTKEEPFFLTYGDGVSNVNIDTLLSSHQTSGKSVTMTAVRPTPRFGGLHFNDQQELLSFKEKPQTGEGWINGGFFICEPDIYNYLSSDQDVLEQQPLERLLADGKLGAYQHPGFWQCMDTIREKQYLNELWNSEAPWKVW